MQTAATISGSSPRTAPPCFVRAAGLRRLLRLSLAAAAAGLLTLCPARNAGFAGGLQPAATTADEGFESSDLSRWNWHTGGDAEWYVTADDANSGICSARAGEIGANQSSYLEITLVRDAGNISFFRRTSCEYWDNLNFFVDGALKAQWGGETAWGTSAQSFPVTAGRHTYRWTYAKDGSNSGDSDTAWIDDIIFPPQASGSPEIGWYADPARLYFRASAGHQSPPAQTFLLANTGGGTLNWTVKKPRPWLSLSPATGTSRGDAAVVTASVRTGTLTPGRYQDAVTITAPGATNTPQAVLVVFDVDRPYDEDFESGGLTHLPWRPGGAHPGAGCDQAAYEGSYCATSGAAGNGEISYLEVTLTRQAGNVTFHRRFTEHSGPPSLLFLIDGQQRGEWGGSVPWSSTPETYGVAAGTHTYRWELRGYDSVSAGRLDDIMFPPPAPPTRVAFVQQPTGTPADGILYPTVTVAVLDAGGNRVAGATNPVTVVLGDNPSAATLTGDLTVNAEDGIATFPDLSVDKAGQGYTLAASAPGLTGATSDPFDVTVPGVPARIVFRRQPANSTAGEVIAPAVQAEIRDAFGTLVPTATNTVVAGIARNPAGGTLSGATAVDAVNGVATFSDLSINKAGTGYRLSVSSDGLRGAVSATFDVSVGAPDHLGFLVQPASVSAGVAITPPVRVAIQDQGGNTVAAATDAVSLALFDNPGGGTLSGASSVGAVNGVATFANLKVDRAGSGYSLSAAAPGLQGAVSRRFNVARGPARRLAFLQQPSPAVVDAAITPAVRVGVTDDQGNVIATATDRIALALGTNPGPATFAAQTVAAVSGVATFPSVRINKPGAGYTLRATATGRATATSTPFAVTGQVAALGFTLQPPDSTAAGSPFTVKVSLHDRDGKLVDAATNRVTVAIGANPGRGLLSGVKTLAAVAGVATFTDLSINKAGSGYTLTAATAGLQAAATSEAFDIVPGAPARLAFLQQPRSTAAGAQIAPAVRVAVQDACGNLVATATNTVAAGLSRNPAGGTLSGTTAVDAVGGVATFADLSINRPGTGYALAVSGEGLRGANSAPFSITAGPPARLAFSVQPPASVAAGAAFSVKVAVQDGSGNPAAAATNAITLALLGNPSGGALRGSARANATGGLATFAGLSVDKAGAGYTLEATAAGLSAAESRRFTVAVGAPAKLAFVQQPTDVLVSANVTPPVVVAVTDAQGNRVPTATNTVTLTLGVNAGGATFVPRSTRAVNGAATFATVAINKPGVGYRLRAAATGLSSTDSASFGVGARGASRVVFSLQPPRSVAAGTRFTVKVTLRDDVGNNVTTATNPVTLTLAANPGGATLGGTTTVDAVSGVATFSGLSLDKAGRGYTLKATAAGILATATSTVFDVTAGAAGRLVFAQQPTPTVAGAAMAPAVAVRILDAAGNPVANAMNPITLSVASGPAGGALVPAVPSRAAAGGVAVFAGLKVLKAGTYALAASSPGLQGATSDSFEVSAGAASQLLFVTQPPAGAAGAPLAPAPCVGIGDAYGNLVTTATHPIVMALYSNPSHAILSGTTTVPATGGQATFDNLRVSKPGTYTLRATTTGTLPPRPAVSASFAVRIGQKAQLGWLTPPRAAKAGATLPPMQVEIRDAAGNRVADATDRVLLSLDTNLTGATLRGTTARDAVAGIATFDDLSVDRAGEGYTLFASSGTLQGAQSPPFRINVAYHLVFNPEPPAFAGSGTTLAPAPKVEVRDDAGNLVGMPITVRLALERGADQGTLSGTLSAVADGGIATFDTLKITLPASAPSFPPVPFSLRATAVGLQSLESTMVVVMRSQ